MWINLVRKNLIFGCETSVPRFRLTQTKTNIRYLKGLIKSIDVLEARRSLGYTYKPSPILDTTRCTVETQQMAGIILGTILVQYISWSMVGIRATAIGQIRNPPPT